MSAAFVPTFTRHLTQRGRANAWRLGNLVISMLILVTSAIAILGMVFAEPAVVVGDQIAIRPMAYLTLGFDHRLIDGATADRFMSALKQELEHCEI